MALRTFEPKKGGLSSRSIRDGAVAPSKLHRLLLEGAHAMEACNYQPPATDVDGFSNPTGIAADINLMHLRSSTWSYFIMGAQVIVAPTNDATAGGILIGLDAAAADGVEYLPGQMATVKNPFAVTIGTSPNAAVRATLRAGTLANVAELALGWRKAEAFNALIDNYDEMACLNIQTPGDIKRETILNNGATVTVDTLLNASNGVDVVLEVRLIGRRALMFVNGAAAPIGAAFNFDVGEIVVPFLHFLQVTGGSTLHMFDYEVGPLYGIGLDPARH